MTACNGDDTACESDGCTDGSATASASDSDGTATATTGPTSGGSETGTTTDSGSASDSDGTSTTTTAGTTTSTTSATSESTSTTDTGVTDGTSSTTGPTCEDECLDGVCVGGVCCPVDNACGDMCCGDGQLCAFQTCVDPGDACVTASDCDPGSYCDYSLGEAGDKVCGGGGSPDTGLCMPLPEACEPGEEPDDLDTLACLPVCTFSGDMQYEPDLKYQWTAGRVMMPPIVAQLDDDNCDDKVDGRDIPDILFSSFAGSSYNNNGTLHAYSVIDGAMVEKWKVNPQSNRIWPGKALAAADLDGVPGA
ncbi:MAG: hypothetical protein KC486_35955, partial [Myxococcales bacterium]|nr:hypothetical protein [Myxococcales bacterium]